MEINFNYIRNRIREHQKEDILHQCFNLLDKSKNEIMPRWNVYLLIKWSYIHAGFKKPAKALSIEKFNNILNCIMHLNEDHISHFIKNGRIDESFLILHAQQFYLQKNVYKDKLASHLKLFHSLQSKYDINESFLHKTGITVLEFSRLMEILWFYCNRDEYTPKFFGYINADFFELANCIVSEEKGRMFIKLLTFDPNISADEIINISTNITKIRDVNLQPLEKTFFTIYPLQLYKNRIKLIDNAILNYTANYYIYDYMKLNDEDFTTEFGSRFEKYVECGLKELQLGYTTETQLKKELPKHSKLVDFYLPNENIYIECKAVEIQSYTTINPTDELLYNSLKGSILKAYFEQLLNVSNQVNPNIENWGIILTFKEIFLSHFTQIYELGKDKFENWGNNKCLPPENVFIIDLATWDKIISIVKTGKTTILELLKYARESNSNRETRKQSFYMHLDSYILDNSLDLSYLETEKELLAL